MSDEEVARLLRGLHSKPPKNRDEQEVAGYADLLGRIFDNYQTFKLTEGQILQFHDILLQFSDKDRIHKGKYKSTDNVVVAKDPQGKEFVLFHPTPPYLVKKEMDDALFWINQKLEEKEMHPLLTIANFIFEFLAIHPFNDGNGRLSRALTNLALLQSGYVYIPYISLEEIIEERKADYYLALRETQKHHKSEHENINAWVLFLLDTLLEQTNRARRLITGERPEQLLSEKQITVHQLFATGDTLSVKDVYERLGQTMPQPTVKQALSRLLALKLIERMGAGRSTRYRKIP